MAGLPKSDQPAADHLTDFGKVPDDTIVGAVARLSLRALPSLTLGASSQPRALHPHQTKLVLHDADLLACLLLDGHHVFSEAVYGLYNSCS